VQVRGDFALAEEIHLAEKIGLLRRTLQFVGLYNGQRV
jgi:hypothetical protein